MKNIKNFDNIKIEIKNKYHHLKNKIKWLKNEYKNIDYKKLSKSNENIIINDGYRSLGSIFKKKNILLKYQESLIRFLFKFFSYHHNYNYYQGFNDICSLFLIIFYPNKSDVFAYLNLFIDDYLDLELFKDNKYFFEIVTSKTNDAIKILSKHGINYEENTKLVLPGIICSGFLTFFIHDFLEINCLDSLQKIFYKLIKYSKKDFSVTLSSAILLKIDTWDKDDQIYFITNKYKSYITLIKEKPEELDKLLEDLDKILSIKGIQIYFKKLMYILLLIILVISYIISKIYFI